MELRYEGRSNLGGVYRILNRVTDRYYFGSSFCFKLRATGHISDLKNGRHRNIPLQKDWDLLGPSAFLFEVVEVVEGDRAARLAAEDRWLERFFDGQLKCYNANKKASSRHGSKNQKPYARPPTSDETRRKMSESRRGWRKPLSEETRARNLDRWKQAGASRRGVKRGPPSKETLEKFQRTRELLSRLVLVGPDGSRYQIESVQGFCRERGLPYIRFLEFVREPLVSYPGWSKEQRPGE